MKRKTNERNRHIRSLVRFFLNYKITIIFDTLLTNGHAMNVLKSVLW